MEKLEEKKEPKSIFSGDITPEEKKKFERIFYEELKEWQEPHCCSNHY